MKGTNDAYAPAPIVLDTSRKGRFVGKGAICDCRGWSELRHKTKARFAQRDGSLLQEGVHP